MVSGCLGAGQSAHAVDPCCWSIDVATMPAGGCASGHVMCATFAGRRPYRLRSIDSRRVCVLGSEQVACLHRCMLSSRRPSANSWYPLQIKLPPWKTYWEAWTAEKWDELLRKKRRRAAAVVIDESSGEKIEAALPVDQARFWGDSVSCSRRSHPVDPWWRTPHQAAGTTWDVARTWNCSLAPRKPRAMGR
jgi:hypothetical protein